MRYSLLFGKTKPEAPADADSVNAKFLSQGGFVDRLVAGVYSFLPLGLRVLKKVNQIIREEMDAVGAQEILMPSLHPIEIWKQTGRDKTMDSILFKTKGAGDHDFIFGPSHEETVTPLAGKYIQSYKDLPLCVYQIQTKFRNEPRAKSGILRGREFGMKDMYSFHTDEADLLKYYDKVAQAYFKVFQRCGLEAYMAEASGGAFSDKVSHEFSVKTQAGEDTLLMCAKCRYAKNIELLDEQKRKEAICPKCGGKLTEEKAVEAGNIFILGKKFSNDFGLKFTDKDGKQKEITMGCYGIGNTRLVGTVVEASHDEKGIIWPKSIAPYAVHLLTLGSVDAKVTEAVEKLYKDLQEKGVEVLFDDRDESVGKKLNDADLIGIPLRVVVSKKTLEKNGLEVKKRSEAKSEIIAASELSKYL